MAHGYTNPIHNMVCKDTFQILMRKEDNGQFISKTFTEGQKVCLDGFYGFYSDNPVLPDNKYWHRLNQLQIENVEPENIFYQLDDDYYGDYLYIDKQIVENHFRPIVHKHLATRLFGNITQMNEFLATLKIDCLKDIKMREDDYLVIYIDMGDDE